MLGIKKEGRISDNKENEDSLLLAKMKARIEGMTEKDFVVTEEKIKKY
jgi:hypothetical protein